MSMSKVSARRMPASSCSSSKKKLIMETIKKVFLHFDVPKELLLWYSIYCMGHGRPKLPKSGVTVFLSLLF